MPELTLTKLQIAGGVWTGRLTGPAGAAPRLEATLLDQPVGQLQVRPDAGAPGHWTVSLPIPPEALRDGMQTILIREAQTGGRLASITILLGEPLEDDIRAEVNLLRAELDLLKRAFRRHCADSGS